MRTRLYACLMMLGSVLVATVLVELLLRAFVTLPFFVGESTTVYDPVYGKRLKKNLRTQRIAPEYRSRITINSLGFRGPEPLGPLQHPLLFLGDSFTFGAEVDDDKLFTHLVGKALDKDVVNAGISGIGNGFWVLFLEREATALQPAAVILQHCINDFTDNLQERLFHLQEDGTLVSLPAPPPGILRRVQEVVDAIPGLAASHLISLLRGAEASWRSRLRTDYHTQPLEDEDALTLVLTRRALALCRQHEWPVLGIATHLMGPRFEALAAVYAEFGAELLSMDGPAERPACYFVQNMHWTEAGHAWVAERVTTKLRDKLQ
ncbi:MAG: SGNH/GDSL hydrolase family protein [Desulfovibrio sp.]|nr:SGNH/GDSL hydrolase family protein [Desulfovibrio sp.]